MLRYLPQVADETRNVVIRSQNGGGTRGTVMFLQRANVDIHSAAFRSLGRTTSGAFDDTTFDSRGQVTHIGTNQEDRTPVQFLNLWGPTTAQANGYQFTFADNVVDCPMMSQTHIWGIEVKNSSYGLIQGNVVDNWSGAGIALVSGTEVYNRIEGNFVMRIDGTGERSTTGLDGLGYWFRGPDNFVVNNVATDINQSGAYSYGYVVNATYLGTVQVPAYQGADPSVSGQSISVNMNATPLLQFSGNQSLRSNPQRPELVVARCGLPDSSGRRGDGDGLSRLAPAQLGIFRVRDQQPYDLRVRRFWRSRGHRGPFQRNVVR